MADYIDSNLDDPAKYFTTFLWTGDGTSPRSLTGVGFQPDMMWSKIRDVGHEHSLVDDVRGVDNKRLKTNTNAAEDTTNTHGHFDSLDSDGFTVTGASGYYNVNRNNEPYVGWCWKESATSGFDIVGYTGNSTARTISHSLSAVPKVILGKRRSDASNWCMYHASVGNTKALYLNDSTIGATSTTFWNDTDPTSSVFTVGTDAALNGNTDTQIAYLWSEKQGFSKFGSYKGNGNANGAFVYLGFRPAFLLIKRSSATGVDWILHDNKRAGFNVNDDYLAANTDAAEVTGNTYQNLDLLSNGFKMRGSGTGTNTSGETYVYMALAESPFVNSKKIPNNAR